jgi:four helix bundle protein
MASAHAGNAVGGEEVAVSFQPSAFSRKGKAVIRDFRDIVAWQKAHRLVLLTYAVTKSFPTDERFGLTSQIRRAAVSIPANIAEGCGRSGDAELARFLQIAFASASELEYHFLLSRDLGYLPEAEYERAISDTQEVKRMLFAFIGTLRRGMT